jgi:hypothetical protein
MERGIEAATASAAIVVSHQDPVQALRLALTGRPLTEVPHDKPAHAEVISLLHRGERWVEGSRWKPDVPETSFP